VKNLNEREATSNEQQDRSRIILKQAMKLENEQPLFLLSDT
jgi:hypothetical protein